jgi:hypothetical protein
MENNCARHELCSLYAAWSGDQVFELAPQSVEGLLHPRVTQVMRLVDRSHLLPAHT